MTRCGGTSEDALALRYEYKLHPEMACLFTGHKWMELYEEPFLPGVILIDTKYRAQALQVMSSVLKALPGGEHKLPGDYVPTLTPPAAGSGNTLGVLSQYHAIYCLSCYLLLRSPDLGCNHPLNRHPKSALFELSAWRKEVLHPDVDQFKIGRSDKVAREGRLFDSAVETRAVAVVTSVMQSEIRPMMAKLDRIDRNLTPTHDIGRGNGGDELSSPIMLEDGMASARQLLPTGIVRVLQPPPPPPPPPPLDHMQLLLPWL